MLFDIWKYDKALDVRNLPPNSLKLSYPTRVLYEGVNSGKSGKSLGIHFIPWKVAEFCEKSGKSRGVL